MSFAEEACELADVVSRGRVAIPIHGNGSGDATHDGGTGSDGGDRDDDCGGYEAVCVVACAG